MAIPTIKKALGPLDILKVSRNMITEALLEKLKAHFLSLFSLNRYITY